MAKTGNMPIGFIILAAGATLLYSGITGHNPITLVKETLSTGKVPKPTLQIQPTGIGNPITGAGYPGVPPGTSQNAMQAIAWAAHQISNPSKDWTNRCLEFVEDAWGNPIGNLGTAALAWQRCTHKHPNTPYSMVPPGALVWWGGGDGHTALSIGGGYCISTDIKRLGKADRVRISLIHRKWGKPYLGYTTDLAGVILI